MKKRIEVLVILLSVMFLVINVSAGVYFSQPETVYNLGDIIDVSADVSPLGEGPLKVEMFCDGNSLIVFYNSNPAESVSIQLPLTSLHIQDLTGECYFLANYGGSDFKSAEFRISKKLDVRLAIDSIFVKPGEEIVISGTAKRLNGVGINGEVEMTIPVLSLIVSQTDEVESEVESDEDAEEGEEVDEVVDEEGNESEERGDEDGEEVDEESEEGSVPEAEAVSVDVGTYYGNVVDGVFSISFSLGSDTPAGNYRIDVLAYEGDSGERTSEGIAMANLEVFQISTSIDAALSGQNLNPGDGFSFQPLLMDQTGISISDETSVVIRDGSLNRIFESLVQSGETVNYNIPTNLTAGYYEVVVSSGELNVVKSFYVNEKEIVSFALDNGTLIVTNIGNIPYDNDIQVDLNGKPFVRSVDLGLQESQEFRLLGSDGEYDIKISDGETEITQGGVALTGNAVGVEYIKRSSLRLNTPIVWIFFIVVLGAGALFLFRNVFKKKSFAYPFAGRFKKKSKDAVVDEKGNVVKKEVEGVKPKLDGGAPAKSDVPVSKTPVPNVPVSKAPVSQNEAEQVLVLRGHKSRAAVVALKIKNKIGRVEKQSLEKAIEHVYMKKGAVYEQGDFIFIVFSPLMTKSFKNEVEATKAAEKISLVLKEHNKKFKDKIDFGIGINSGEIINKMDNKKLKFTALGNLVVGAKRLAESSDEQILVTKEAYEHGINEIKAQKKKIAHGEVYEVRRVIYQDKNKAFIKGFLDRMDKGQIK